MTAARRETRPAADTRSSDAELIADFKAAMDVAGIKTKDTIEADGERQWQQHDLRRRGGAP